MTEFRLFSDTKARAAIHALKHLSTAVSPEAQDSVAERINRALHRRTVSLLRSGYTDLVSTGSIRVIRDPGLRDHILSFYEEAERTERILEKSTTQSTDVLLMGALVGGGFWFSRPSDVELNDNIAERNSRLRGLFGDDYTYPPDALWRYRSDSPGWDRVWSALMKLGYDESMNGVLADRLVVQARSLRAQIDDWLAGVIPNKDMLPPPRAGGSGVVRLAPHGHGSA